MSDEQNKPVRSREDESTINRISASIQPNWQNDPSEAELQFFYRIAEKAFDAATAEQRRKDAEGQEIPSAWVRPNDFYNDEVDERFGPWSSERSGKCTIPLYTQPANVAALEDRIAELEEALKEIIDTAGADCIHGLGPYIKIAQAALKRKGTTS